MDILSILKIKKFQIEEIKVNGNKTLVETKINPKGQYGGYTHYFWNLAHGRYRNNPEDKYEGWGGPRTLKFLMKYISTTDKILSHKKPITVLDIGCSSGFLRKFLESNTFKQEEIYYYGIDIRKKVLEKAVFNTIDIESAAEGDNVKTLYINWDVRKGLPFQDNSFDFIVSFEMTKYLEKKDVKKLFKEVARALKDKGHFIYSVAGIGNNEEQRNRIHKMWKNNMSSFWHTDEIEKALSREGLYIERIYGSEVNYDMIKNSLKKEDKSLFYKMDAIYPKELIQAILGPFYPRATSTKLLFVRKGKINLLKEIQREFPKHNIIEIPSTYKINNNTMVFRIDGSRVLKYISQGILDKELYVYDILRRQTYINLPTIINIIRDSSVVGYSLIEMNDVGDPLWQVWDNITDKERKSFILTLVDFLKQVHSIHFNPSRAKVFLRLSSSLFQNEFYPSTWKEEISLFCQKWFEYVSRNNLLNNNIRNRLLKIVDDNIEYIRTGVYSLVSLDLNTNNLTVDKQRKMNLLIDFETTGIGDRFLDVVITASYIRFRFGKTYEKLFLDSYGVNDNFSHIAKVYRIILLILYWNNMIPSIDLKNKEYESFLFNFIERGDFFAPRTWLKKSKSK